MRAVDTTSHAPHEATFREHPAVSDSRDTSGLVAAHAATAAASARLVIPAPVASRYAPLETTRVAPAGGARARGLVVVAARRRAAHNTNKRSADGNGVPGAPGCRGYVGAAAAAAAATRSALRNAAAVCFAVRTALCQTRAACRWPPADRACHAVSAFAAASALAPVLGFENCTTQLQPQYRCEWS